MDITIYENPVPQQRPRFSNVNGFGVIYDPCKVKKKSTKYEIEKQISEKKILMFSEDQPISVEMVFGMPIPKYFNNAKKKSILWKIDYHYVKPDVDNLVKFYQDCCNGIVWKDDCQIFQLKAKKIYTEKPFVNIKAKKMISDLDKNEEAFVSIFTIEDISKLRVDIAMLNLEMMVAIETSEFPIEAAKKFLPTLSYFAKEYSKKLETLSRKTYYETNEETADSVLSNEKTNQ